MKKAILIMSTFVCGLVVVGCAGEETHTVEWYKNNKEALSKKITECKNNPGEKANTPNCINAKIADNQIVKSKKLVRDGLLLAAASKIAIVEYYANYNKWPEDNSTAGVANPELIKGLGVDSVTISGNTIRIVYTDPVTTDTENNDIILTATQVNNSISFSCSGGRLPNELRPEECQIP